jgi:hypothetical protein
MKNTTHLARRLKVLSEPGPLEVFSPICPTISNLFLIIKNGVFKAKKNTPHNDFDCVLRNRAKGVMLFIFMNAKMKGKEPQLFCILIFSRSPFLLC